MNDDTELVYSQGGQRGHLLSGRGRGRKTKCTPERIAIITQALRMGAALCHAAVLAGVTPSAMSEWMRRGELTGRKPYVDIYNAARLAQAEFVNDSLAMIKKAALNGDGKLALELLGRRMPAHYGHRRDPGAGVEVNVGVGVQVSSGPTDLDGLTEEDLADIARYILEKKRRRAALAVAAGPVIDVERPDERSPAVMRRRPQEA